MSKPTILIVNYIKNMDYCFPQWKEAVLNIDHPKDKIKIVIIENDSIDTTWEVINEFKDEYSKDYQKISTLQLDTGGQDTMWWDARKNTEQYNKFVQFIVTIHNDIIPRYMKGTDYINILQADNIAPPHIYKSHLKVFEKYLNTGMVTGLIRERASSFDGRSILSARKVVSMNPPKPWRLDPIRPIAWKGCGADSINRTAYLYPPEEQPKTSELKGVVKTALCFPTMFIPTKVYEKLKMWYHVDDQIVSYTYQFEDMGMDYYLNLDVKLIHIDRDGTFTGF